MQLNKDIRIILSVQYSISVKVCLHLNFFTQTALFVAIIVSFFSCIYIKNMDCYCNAQVTNDLDKIGKA